VIIEMN